MEDLTLIRQSMRMDFKKCPRKLYWSQVAGVAPKTEGIALTLGTVFHHGLHMWRTGKPMSEAIDLATTSLKVMLVERGSTPEEIEDESARMTAYLSGYPIAYPNDINLDWQPELELKTKTEQGTLDALYRNEHGEMCIVDDKTRSRMAKDLPLLVGMDEQLMNYYDLLKKVKKVKAVSGSIREMKKAGIKRTKKESAEQYAQRVLDLYCTKPSEHYQEAFIDFDHEKLKQFMSFKTRKNAEIRRAFREAKPVEKWAWNYQECNGMYGQCPYLRLCNGLGDPTQDYYKPSENRSLDNGRERTRIWGFDPKPNSPTQGEDYSTPPS